MSYTNIKFINRYDKYEHNINTEDYLSSVMIDGQTKWILCNSDDLEMLKRYLWILTVCMIQN